MVSFACPVGVVALYVYMICGVMSMVQELGFHLGKSHPLENATKFADVKKHPAAQIRNANERLVCIIEPDSLPACSLPVAIALSRVP